MLSIVSYLKGTLTENWCLATVHKEVIVLRHQGKTLVEILEEVKNMFTGNNADRSFSIQKKTNVLTKYIVLN